MSGNTLLSPPFCAQAPLAQVAGAHSLLLRIVVGRYGPALWVAKLLRTCHSLTKSKVGAAVFS